MTDTIYYNYWQCRLEDLFFPVGLHAIYFAKNKDVKPYDVPTALCKAPKFRGVVDEEHNIMLSCVTTSYHLITNKEAYNMGLEISDILFNVDSSDYYMSYGCVDKWRGSCYMFLVFNRTLDIKNTHHSWKAFVRITNSYDKTKSLRYEVGFALETLNYNTIPTGLLVPSLSLDFAINHLWLPETIHKKLIGAANEKYNGVDVFSQFLEMVERLLEIPVVDDEILPLFCRLADIPKLKENDPKDHYLAECVYKIELNSKKWIKDCGQNAYAALCAFTEFAATEKMNIQFIKNVDESQAKIGVFMEELIKASLRPDFSLDDFIGKKAREVKKQIKMMISKGGL